jgi:sarcosine oxidase
MRTCSVAVIGLGVMGSSALYSLAKDGVDVLGFDPLIPGGTRGSSHGSCRVYRRFNFESDAYTALSDRAFAVWAELEAASGTQVLLPSRLLEAGPAGCRLVAASRSAAARVNAPTGPTKGSEINARYPAFRLPDDWDVVMQDSGGILLADQAVRLFRAAAADRIIPLAATIAPRSSGILITTSDTARYEATQSVIIAAGPWIAELEPRLTNHLTVTRQPVAWFTPAQPALVAYRNFPLFILDGPHGMVYGFPDFEGRGVKAALHNHGAPVGPDAWAPPATEAELAPVSRTLGEFVPGASGPIADQDVCLYTNTERGDVDGSAAEEFIIDRLSEDRRIILASPCSGHGFKFASAIGRDLAKMAVDLDCEADEAFRLSRFSAFARPRRRRADEAGDK